MQALGDCTAAARNLVFETVQDVITCEAPGMRPCAAARGPAHMQLQSTFVMVDAIRMIMSTAVCCNTAAGAVHILRIWDIYTKRAISLKADINRYVVPPRLLQASEASVSGCIKPPCPGGPVAWPWA